MGKNKNNIVRKANKLIEAHYKLTLNEHKILCYLISNLKIADNFITFEVKLTELIKYLGIEKNKRAYEDIRRYNKNLIKNIITFKNNEGKVIDTVWLTMAGYDNKNSKVMYKFNTDLKGYLLNLKKYYTEYLRKNIRYLSSTYSLRIYEILKMYEFKRYTEITIEDLKKMLALKNKYETYNEFKRNVLIKAQKEINLNTDITFTYEEIKESRKVVALGFHIIPKKNDKQNDKEKREIIELNSNFKNLAQNFNKKYSANMQCNFIKMLVDEKGFDIVETCIDIFGEYVSKAKEVEKTFFDFTMKYGTDRAYTKTSNYNKKPQQQNNYEQRDYDDDFFNSLYDNISAEEVKKIKRV